MFQQITIKFLQNLYKTVYVLLVVLINKRGNYSFSGGSVMFDDFIILNYTTKTFNYYYNF